MAKGGARTGAGRPVGSKTVWRFQDYVSKKDRDEFVEFMLATYKGDMNVAKWVGDHLFAKPAQAVVTEDEDGKRIPLGVEIVVRKS